ncbi:hypothetical protein BDZ89DRAFT_1063491 [Hymenopellis radicata]|nr:hypothetical protein BDZ89DRAFT_1063491 [Hymenopellis radicata]
MSSDSNTSVEFCPKCCASMTLKSYTLPFATNVARAYHNLSRVDAFTLESGLSDPIAESAALAVEIPRLEILLGTLKKHRAHLDCHIRQTRAYTAHSPIRQLPTEILTLIFGFACTSYQAEYHKTPLSISLVCSKWREIAMAAPCLWTNIYVGPELEPPTLFKYYLERCGELPISLKIDKDLSLSHESLVEGIHEVYSTFRRWKVVEFHVETEDMVFLSDHTTKDGPGLPILESLTLAPKSPVLDFEHLPSAFRNAPHLTRLDLNDADELWRNSGPPTKVSDIRTNQNYLECLVDLSRSFTDRKDGNSTLVVYTSCPLLGDLDRLGNRTFLLSPSITHIVFESEVWATDLKRFLESASIPGLKALTLVARDPADTDGRRCSISQRWCNLLEAVPKLLENSKCSLESFNLTMHGRYRAQHVCLAAPMAQSLVHALQAMSKLQSLTIIEAISGPPLLTELIPEMTDRSLIPQLAALELVWAEDRHPDDSLMAMLSSRVGDGEGLSSVVLGRRNGGEFMPTVLDNLQELRKSGVRAGLW